MAKLCNQDLGNQELNDMQGQTDTNVQSRGIEYQEITPKNKVKLPLCFFN